jgi:hypothetical protein
LLGEVDGPQASPDRFTACGNKDEVAEHVL